MYKPVLGLDKHYTGHLNCFKTNLKAPLRRQSEKTLKNSTQWYMTDVILAKNYRLLHR